MPIWPFIVNNLAPIQQQQHPALGRFRKKTVRIVVCNFPLPIERPLFSENAGEEFFVPSLSRKCLFSQTKRFTRVVDWKLSFIEPLGKLASDLLNRGYVSLSALFSDGGSRPEGESLREVDVGGGGGIVVEAGGEPDQVSHLVFVLGSGLILKFLQLINDESDPT